MDLNRLFFLSNTISRTFKISQSANHFLKNRTCYVTKRVTKNVGNRNGKNKKGGKSIGFVSEFKK